MENRYNAVDFNKYVYYDETSPSGLRWLDCRNRVKDDPVGRLYRDKITKEPQGWMFRIGRKSYLVHRVIWKIFHKEISSDLVIDHIDQNPLNNRIENLRLVTQSVNLRNSRKKSNNTSGETNVIKYSYATKNAVTTFYIVRIMVDGKKYSKRFTCKKYPDAFEAAKEWRDNKIIELNANGAGITDRHGK